MQSRGRVVQRQPGSRDPTPPRETTPTRKTRRKRRVESPESLELKPTKKPLQKNYPIVNGIVLSPENISKLIPNGFKFVPLPDDYVPVETPDLSLVPEKEFSMATIPNALADPAQFDPQIIASIPDLPQLKDIDYVVFRKLLLSKDPSLLPLEEQNELKCMRLILKVKNTTQITRKLAMRTLLDHSQEYATFIFNVTLQLLAEPALEEHERHVMVRLLDRVLRKLDGEVKPFTAQILKVVTPLLVDEKKYTKLEARDIISNLAKSAGLLTMISTLRKDIENPDDQTRHLISRTFAVVANSLGITALLPFLKSICHSTTSWTQKHTGISIIQQIAILMGSSILPHLPSLVACISSSITDENVQVRSMTAATISSLAEASRPFGYESFEILIEPLHITLKTQRGRTLSQFLRALGNLIPLMDKEYSEYYSADLIRVMSKELNNPDDDLRRSILIVTEKICGLAPKKSVKSISNSFFKAFWTRRVAIDKKIAGLCISSIHALAKVLGTETTIGKLLSSLKDESEPFRRMGMSTVDRILYDLGSYELSDRDVERLLDGLVYIVQHQTFTSNSNQVPHKIIESFGNIMNSLGSRSRPHISTITSALLYRLQHKDTAIREQAADLIDKLTLSLKACNEIELSQKLYTILYESLGEVYPNVLGSILLALRSVLKSLPKSVELTPPIPQLLSTLTPILRNRHEKVQENTLNLLGDLTTTPIPPTEWIRISYELLDLLKAYKKSIRKAANSTFGLISQTIGPSDLLPQLLNNLKMSERQLRVCTSVALAIIADKCGPFTVIPALLNEYRLPDKNVQNGVLKTMSFLFEYGGSNASDYIYSVTPLLSHALTDRDLVHRQTASTAVYHMAIGAIDAGYDDAFINFLDLIWPNVFETSPHLISAVTECIESLSFVLGPGIIMGYLWSGLAHPARKVRTSYWKIWNSLYISHAGMVAYLPRLEINNDKSLVIEELDVWI